MVQFLGQQYLCEHFKDVEGNKTQGCGIVGLISSVTLGYAIRVKASWSMKQLLHVYVKAVKWICQSCSIYFLPLAKQNRAEVVGASALNKRC